MDAKRNAELHMRAADLDMRAADHHEQAAAYHESAARHHREAAKYYELGEFKRAAYHSQLALGDVRNAQRHAGEATHAHVDHYLEIAAA
jgi:hypothetical protein